MMDGRCTRNIGTAPNTAEQSESGQVLHKNHAAFLGSMSDNRLILLDKISITAA
jgi:hypothetical protein